MTVCGIYQMRNAVTGRVYIGSSRDCRRRFSEHRGRLRRGAHINGKLQASWNKHGEAAFEFSILASVLNPDHLESVEQQFLDEHDAVGSGYNLAPTAGNTAGWRASDETRARMSEAAKRRDNSVQIKAMAAATRGISRPPHVIEAIRRAHTNKKVSDETRKKMSASAVRRSRYSQADRQRMSEMLEAGATWRAVSEHFGVGTAAIGVYVKRWRAEHAGQSQTA